MSVAANCVAVRELDGQRLAALDDVAVGQDVAVGGEDDARADAGRRDVCRKPREEKPSDGDGHDRIADGRDDVGEVGRARGGGVPGRAGDAGRPVGPGGAARAARGPATRAAVPLAARTADRSETARTEPSRRSRRRSLGDAAGTVAAGAAGAPTSGEVGRESAVGGTKPGGVSGWKVTPRSRSVIGCSDRGGIVGSVRSPSIEPARPEKTVRIEGGASQPLGTRRVMTESSLDRSSRFCVTVNQTRLSNRRWDIELPNGDR